MTSSMFTSTDELIKQAVDKISSRLFESALRDLGRASKGKTGRGYIGFLKGLCHYFTGDMKSALGELENTWRFSYFYESHIIVPTFITLMVIDETLDNHEEALWHSKNFADYSTFMENYGSSESNDVFVAMITYGQLIEKSIREDVFHHLKKEFSFPYPLTYLMGIKFKE